MELHRTTLEVTPTGTSVRSKLVYLDPAVSAEAITTVREQILDQGGAVAGEESEFGFNYEIDSEGENQLNSLTAYDESPGTRVGVSFQAQFSGPESGDYERFSSWVSELGVPLPEGAVYQGGGLGEHIVPEGASTTGWDGEHLDAIYLFPNKDNDTVWVEIQQIGKNTGFVVPSSGEKRLINEEYEISYEFTVSGLEVSLNFRESRRGASS